AAEHARPDSRDDGQHYAEAGRRAGPRPRPWPRRQGERLRLQAWRARPGGKDHARVDYGGSRPLVSPRLPGPERKTQGRGTSHRRLPVEAAVFAFPLILVCGRGWSLRKPRLMTDRGLRILQRRPHNPPSAIQQVEV